MSTTETEPTSPHKFHYRDEDWTLFHRKDNQNPAWKFAPYWGERGLKSEKTFRHKVTKQPLPFEDALAAAKKLIDARMAGPDQYKAMVEQTQQRGLLTVAKLLEAYEAAGCPARPSQIDGRAEDSIASEKRHIVVLAWWGSTLASAITDKMRDDYREHRRLSVRARKDGSRPPELGARTTELELQTLNNALLWAYRTSLLREMPRSTKCRYRNRKKIAHRRYQSPINGDELHNMAAWCFDRAAERQAREPAPGQPRRGNRSGTSAGQLETYGWAILLAGLTGLRSGELAMLLSEPKRLGLDYQPGAIDAQFLHVQREKHGRNPMIELDDASRPHIAPLLAAIRRWHAGRYPKHHFMLPGARPDKALNDRGLGRAINAAAAALGIGKRCPHGLRAYYTNVRLAQGMKPDEVAQELGQGSGDELVRDVYGIDPADFRASRWTSLAHQYTWLPSTADKAPAWARWQQAENIVRLAEAV